MFSTPSNVRAFVPCILIRNPDALLANSLAPILTGVPQEDEAKGSAKGSKKGKTVAADADYVCLVRARLKNLKISTSVSALTRRCESLEYRARRLLPKTTCDSRNNSVRCSKCTPTASCNAAMFPKRKKSSKLSGKSARRKRKRLILSSGQHLAVLRKARQTKQRKAARKAPKPKLQKAGQRRVLTQLLLLELRIPNNRLPKAKQTSHQTKKQHQHRLPNQHPRLLQKLSPLASKSRRRAASRDSALARFAVVWFDATAPCRERVARVLRSSRMMLLLVRIVGVLVCLGTVVCVLV